MIARIAGRLEEVGPGTVLIDAGAGVWYEILIPACDVERLSRRVGQDVALHTIHYLEGDPSHGAQTPRLVGFLTEGDRRFFRIFTTVKGIGIRKALRAMAQPVPAVAAAIQAKDARLLATLPEIGKRTAEQIIAELSGKIDEFAGPALPREAPQLPEAADEAVAVLVQLGERRPDAIALVERVLAAQPQMTSPEAIIQQAYRLKTGSSRAVSSQHAT
jgi:Holliday junction DNA helicase RuvA